MEKEELRDYSQWCPYSFQLAKLYVCEMEKMKGKKKTYFFSFLPPLYLKNIYLLCEDKMCIENINPFWIPVVSQDLVQMLKWRSDLFKMN